MRQLVGTGETMIEGDADEQGFGVALKLTFAGNNQLTHISTYVFGVVVVGCILVQMVTHSSHTLPYRRC